MGAEGSCEICIVHCTGQGTVHGRKGVPASSYKSYRPAVSPQVTQGVGARAPLPSSPSNTVSKVASKPAPVPSSFSSTNAARSRSKLALLSRSEPWSGLLSPLHRNRTSTAHSTHSAADPCKIYAPAVGAAVGAA